MWRFVDLIPVEGKSYEILKKSIITACIGSVIKNKTVVVGECVTDTRMNMGVPLKSGYGKRGFKSFIKNTHASLGMRCVEPTSLHPEQLVGKSIPIRDNTGNIIDIKVNLGYLADDFVIFDEAYDLITSTQPLYEQARNYLNIALDPVGENEILKKSVDIEIDKAVIYSPHCTIVFFYQPVPVPYTVITRGFMRRVFIVSCRPSKQEREIALEKSLSKEMNKDLWIEWINWLSQIRQLEFRWEFVDIPAIIKSIRGLYKLGEEFGPKVKSFVDIVYPFTLRDRLIKLACIMSASRMTGVVDDFSIRDATNLMREMWLTQLAYLEETMKISPEVGLSIEDDIISQLKIGSLTVPELVNIVSTKRNVSSGYVKYVLMELIRQGAIKLVGENVVRLPQIGEGEWTSS